MLFCTPLTLGALAWAPTDKLLSPARAELSLARRPGCGAEVDPEAVLLPAEPDSGEVGLVGGSIESLGSAAEGGGSSSILGLCHFWVVVTECAGAAASQLGCFKVQVSSRLGAACGLQTRRWERGTPDCAGQAPSELQMMCPMTEPSSFSEARWQAPPCGAPHQVAAKCGRWGDLLDLEWGVDCSGDQETVHYIQGSLSLCLCSTKKDYRHPAHHFRPGRPRPPS